MIKISVIVVTFNSERTIKDCIESLIEDSANKEVIVVDNGSTDKTCEIIKGFGKTVKLLETGANLGFAKANNLGVKLATGEYIIFLNPDTKILEKNSLIKLQENLENNNDYGLIGPKLIYSDGSIQARTRNLPTIIRAFKEYVFGNKGAYDFYEPKSKELNEVESVIGACMIIKKDLFEKVGGFDERFFMYYEDLDLCKKVRQKGFKVGFLPDVTIEHAEGKSGENQNTSQMLKTSAKKYHGLINYLIIQAIIKLGTSKKNLVWVLIFFLCAAFFRIFFLDLIEFKLDEATVVYQTVQFYLSPYIIQRGLISGIGVHNFPLFNYLIILFSGFSRDPQLISFLIALINTILVPIFYIVIKKYYDKQTSIFASFILAFSPWAIIFSRKIWAQDLILLLMIPLLILLHELILKKKIIYSLPIFFLLSLLIQLHGSGLFFTIATVLILLLLRIRINFLQSLFGFLIGFIFAIPYFVFQINSNPICPDCEAFLGYQSSIRAFDIYSFIRPFQLINGQGYHFILGNNYDGFISSFLYLKYFKYIFLSSFLIMFAGVFFIFTKKRNYLFLVLYLIIIPILYYVTRTKAYMHYFVILIPIISIICGLAFNSLFNLTKNMAFKTLIVLSFATLIIVNIVFTTYLYRYLSITKIIDGDYGPIFSETKSLVDTQINKYYNLPYYQELQSYTYLKPKEIHKQLNEFFLQKGEVNLAEEEYKKYLKINK